MKRFSDIQKKSKLRRINEADESQANLPQNFQDMSKEELLKLMAGQSTKTEIKEEEPKKEDENAEVSEGGDVVKFFSKLFESREMAHVYHLTVKGEEGSHAAHTALGDFYEGILGFIDDMIEIHQGQYGIIEGYDIIDTSETRSKDKIEYFEELANFVKSEKKCFKPEDSHILNIVDEAVALIYKTLYKLKYNK